MREVIFCAGQKIKSHTNQNSEVRTLVFFISLSMFWALSRDFSRQQHFLHDHEHEYEHEHEQEREHKYKRT